MKKTRWAGLVLAGVVGLNLLLSGCGSEEEKIEAALITGMAGLEESEVTQQLWEGISTWERGSDCTAEVYSAQAENAASYELAIEDAVKKGAEVVVLRGDLARQAVYVMQKLEGKVHFILWDQQPYDAASGKEKIRNNTTVMTVNHKEAGFLAGYAAAKEGYKKLGFLAGDASEEAEEYQKGFLAGVKACAEDNHYIEGSMEVRVRTLGSNSISPTLEDEIAEWYTEGCQLILACQSGPAYLAKTAAEARGGKYMAMDKEDAASGACVGYASADYTTGSYIAMKSWEDESLRGGKIVDLDASDGCVSLILTDGYWNSFTAASRDEIAQKLSEGEYEKILKEEIAPSGNYTNGDQKFII